MQIKTKQFIKNSIKKAIVTEGITVALNGAKKISSIVAKNIVQHLKVSYETYIIDDIIQINNWFKNNITEYNELFIINKYSFSILPGSYSYKYKNYYINLILFIDKTNDGNINNNVIVNIYGKDPNKLLKEIIGIKRNKDCIDCCMIKNSYSQKRFFIKNRNMNTIFSEQKKEIIDHIEVWLHSKKIYENLGLIYKDGILLYGKPGTGKTSIARALATKYNMDIICINLSTEGLDKLTNFELNGTDLFNDDNFDNNFDNNAEISSKKYIVLIEEIDYPLKDENHKDEFENKLTQILDGVSSAENCYFIFTTNDVSVIPEKWLRFGRISKSIEMKYFSKEYAKKICKKFDIIFNENKYTNEIQPSELMKDILSTLITRRK